MKKEGESEKSREKGGELRKLHFLKLVIYLLLYNISTIGIFYYLLVLIFYFKIIVDSYAVVSNDIKRAHIHFIQFSPTIL